MNNLPRQNTDITSPNFGGISTPQPQPAPKNRLKVEPESGGQLEQFLIENKKAHDAEVSAREDEAAYKLSVKTWLLSLFPPSLDGTPNPDLPDAFDIAADPHGRYPAYTMTLKGKDSFRLDTEVLKAQAPEVYEHFSVPVTPAWELRESTQGRGRRRGLLHREEAGEPGPGQGGDRRAEEAVHGPPAGRVEAAPGPAVRAAHIRGHQWQGHLLRRGLPLAERDRRPGQEEAVVSSRLREVSSQLCSRSRMLSACSGTSDLVTGMSCT
jgi:hypothetical protein